MFFLRDECQFLGREGVVQGWWEGHGGYVMEFAYAAVDMEGSEEPMKRLHDTYRDFARGRET